MISNAESRLAAHVVQFTSVTLISHWKHCSSMCVASVGLETPWICAQRVMTLLLMLVQHLSWLYKPTWAWQFRLLSRNVALLFSFRWGSYSSVASLRCTPSRSSPRCKSRLYPERLLATSSQLSMSMSIALMSLLQTSMKRRWGCPSDFLSVASSPQRRTFGILSFVIWNQYGQM